MTAESAAAPEQSKSDWVRVAIVVVLTLVTWGILLLTAPTLLYAICYLLALVAGVAIVVYPQVGIYVIALLLIGQWPFNLFRYLGLLTMAASFTYLLLHDKRLLPRNPILLLVGFFVFAILVSAIQPRTNVAMFSILVAYIANCALVWLLLVMADSRQLIINLVRVLIFSGVVVAIIGLVQWRTHFVWIESTTANSLVYNAKTFRGKTGFDLQQWQGEFRVDSIVGTPDYLPIYMQSLAVFVAFSMVRQKRWSLRLLMFGILLLFAFCHLLSYTRGALITTAFVVALTGWVIDRKRFMVLAPLVSVAILVALLSWTPWRERLWTMLDFRSNEQLESMNSGAWRLSTIPVGLEILSERPFFGVGIGQGQYSWPERTYGVLIPDPRHAEPPPFHNDYLGVAVEMGIFGFAALIVLLVGSVYYLAVVSRQFQRRGDIKMADIASALLVSTLGIAAAMALYPLIANCKYIWFSFGLVAALVRYERTLEPLPVEA